MEGGISIHLAPLALAHFGNWPVTNTLVTMVTVSILFIVLAYFAGRSLSLKPRGWQVILESLVMYPYQLVRDTLENDAVAERTFPVIMTVFLSVLGANWFGLLPITEGLGFHQPGLSEVTPLFYSPSTDLNYTLALAVIAFFTIEIFGVATLGVVQYGKKFISFKSPIAFAIGIIELVSEIARLISFSFRLFGNVFAGKVLILVILFFVPYLVPVPFSAFELFVGFIQAAIFALLTLFFTKIAISGHDAHEEHGPAHDMAERIVGGSKEGMRHAAADENAVIPL
ncbi:MAG TPA: F0F1 ATP synthase subunit A [Candidatus Paceibacterota bacterium]